MRKMGVEGLGTDIIEIARIEQAIERHGQRFLDRIFTLNEQQYCQRHLKSGKNFAGRFCAKEAIAKALGIGIGKRLAWTDIEVVQSPSGKPEVVFTQEAKKRLGNPNICLSISHCKEYATAVAIVL